MKSLTIILLALLPYRICFAQQSASSTEIKKKSTGVITLTDQVANKQQNFSYVYTLNAAGEEKFKFEDTQVPNDTFKPEISISLANEKAFHVEMQAIFMKRNPNFSPTSIREETIKMLAKVEGTIETVDDENMSTARLKLIKSDKLKIYLIYQDEELQKSKATKKELLVEVIQTDIEFEDGLIKNVIVEVRLPRQGDWDKKEDGIVTFRNNMPIGTGGKFSAEWLPATRVFAFSPCKLMSLSSQEKFTDPSIAKTYDYGKCPLANAFFILGDLIDIKPILESHKEFYGPANQVISLTPKSDEVLLKKETKSKIFDIRTYTDLIGLGEKDPNGLVQVEGSIKFFMLEDKRPFLNQYTYFGGLAYLEAVARLSKIDKNNRYLIPDTLGSAANLIATKSKILNLRTMDLYRFQTRSFNLALNTVHFNFPQVKLTFYLDAKLGIYQTSVSDSLIVKNGKLEKTAAAFTNTVNVIPYGGSLMMKYSHSSSLNLMLTYAVMGNRLLDNRYIQHDGRFLNIYTLDGVFKTSPKSSFFLRTSFAHQMDDARDNFFQAQLGVVFDIFKTKETK